MSRTKGAQGKHKKEKPVKEKKKRGRPSKQHQKQQQHQTINVNIGGGGGGSGGGESGSKQIPVPYQLPYDPSLLTPNYGINDRQPNNPLIDATKDLMTPLMQSIISNQLQRTDRISIKDAVKPVNPIIHEPIPQYTPVSQKDQSHPIPPEIITDMALPITQKTQQKLIKKQIIPQNPPEPTPLHDKYKLPKGTFPLKIPGRIQVSDPEGLGSKIPIENVEGIASNIGVAALTGGATAAGQAFAAGGIAGVMASGEAILGAAVGSGVAAGASTALGNSTAGNVLSGIAGGVVGGVVGKQAGRAAATNEGIRINGTQEEQIPLLGNRLGGSGRQSRLVPPEIQPSHDPTTGETTQWQIPEYHPPGSNTLTIIKGIMNKKIKSVSDGINNLSKQIRGVNTTSGTYAQVPNVDEYEPIPLRQVPTSKSRALQRDILDLQKDKFEQNLNIALTEQRTNAASKIKDMIKLKKQEQGRHALQKDVKQKIQQQKLSDELNNIIETEQKTNAASKIKDMIKLKKEERGRHALQKVVKQKIQEQKLSDELNVIESERKTSAVSKIQSAIKLKRARTEFKKNKELKAVSDAVIGDMQNQINKQQEPFVNAGTKIQKVVRGHSARKETAGILEDVLTQRKMKEIQQNIKAANISKKTLDDAMKELIKESKIKNISNFGKLASQTEILKEVRQIKAAKDKYNKIGESMLTRRENNIRKVNHEFIQTTARDRIKKFQDKISDIDTRSTLPEREKSLKVKEAQEGIMRMDKLIKKKTNAGRPRKTGAEVAGSRLSMLSTTSNRAFMTPKKR